MKDSAKLPSQAIEAFASGNLGRSTLDRAMQVEHSAFELAARGQLQSAVGRTAMGLPVSPIDKVMREIASGISGRNLLTIQETLGAIGSFRGSSIDRALNTAGVISAISENQFPKGLSEQIARATRKMSYNFYQESEMSIAVRNALGLDLAGIGALSRSQQWAGGIAGHSKVELASLLGSSKALHNQLSALTSAAAGVFKATASANLGNAVTSVDIFLPILDSLSATSTKLSLFAGAIDVLGPRASGGVAAFDSLLGDYRTSVELNPTFWRDRSERVRVYRSLDVDDGLIDADATSTVAVLIESGVVEGRINRNGTVSAIVQVGPVRMEIFASRPRVGAYEAISAFEISLRAFIARKLEAVNGPNWFKQRVPGEVGGRAKERRREAQRSGETPMALINYVDLGDMIPIVTRNDNWAEIFEAVFDRSEWFKVDIERLNANRRPTVHSRPVDGVRLCETVLVIRKLIGWMELDGAWTNGWDDDL